MGFYLPAFRKSLNDAHVGCDMSIMGTGIYGATPRWTRIGAIIVVCFWYDALGADQLPRQIVGGWCLTSALPGKTYAYRRCKLRELRHHRALGRLRRAGNQLRTQYNQASRRGLVSELWLLGCWAIMAGG